MCKCRPDLQHLVRLDGKTSHCQVSTCPSFSSTVIIPPTLWFYSWGRGYIHRYSVNAFTWNLLSFLAKDLVSPCKQWRRLNCTLAPMARHLRTNMIWFIVKCIGHTEDYRTDFRVAGRHENSSIRILFFSALPVKSKQTLNTCGRRVVRKE